MLRRIRYMGLGAMLAYFFDPENGSRRRAAVRDRIFSSAKDKAESMGKPVSAEARAAKEKATNLAQEDKPQPDDVTLARKVETEILRDSDIPKGRINVDAENGKVVLRGEVEKPELIKDLEKRTKKVQGVQEVENLLHVPGAPAPAK